MLGVLPARPPRPSRLTHPPSRFTPSSLRHDSQHAECLVAAAIHVVHAKAMRTTSRQAELPPLCMRVRLVRLDVPPGWAWWEVQHWPLRMTRRPLALTPFRAAAETAPPAAAAAAADTCSWRVTLPYMPPPHLVRLSRAADVVLAVAPDHSSPPRPPLARMTLATMAARGVWLSFHDMQPWQCSSCGDCAVDPGLRQPTAFFAALPWARAVAALLQDVAMARHILKDTEQPLAALLSRPRDHAPLVLYHGTDAAGAAGILRDRALRPSFGMCGTAVYLGADHKAARYAVWTQRYEARRAGDAFLVRCLVLAPHAAFYQASLAAAACSCSTCKQAAAAARGTPRWPWLRCLHAVADHAGHKRAAAGAVGTYVPPLEQHGRAVVRNAEYAVADAARVWPVAIAPVAVPEPAYGGRMARYDPFDRSYQIV